MCDSEYAHSVHLINKRYTKQCARQDFFLSTVHTYEGLGNKLLKYI